MDFTIVRATLMDIPDILNIYYQVYKKDYPLSIGTNSDEIKNAILSPRQYLWLLTKDTKQGNKTIGSIIFHLHPESRTGKVMGVAVLPGYQGNGLARKMVQQGTKILLEKEDNIDALYTTTRTLQVASQLMFLKNGYYPLGIFPNAHKIKSFETLTFMGCFRDKVLDRRKYIKEISTKLKPLLKISNRILGKKKSSCHRKNESIHLNYDLQQSLVKDDFEFILAPEFVKKRYSRKFSREYRNQNFTPFEEPNFMVVSTKSDFELYAYLSKKDHYLAIIGMNQDVEDLGLNNLKHMIFQLKDYGVNYIEILIRLDQDRTIKYFLENQFLPSAICPAFKKENGHHMDFIFLSRTMQPLDFSGMQINEKFKPYVDQYVRSWIEMHVSTLEVVSDRKQEELPSI